MLDQLLASSDPANLAALLVVWWRLDRRLRALAAQIEYRTVPEG